MIHFILFRSGEYFKNELIDILIFLEEIQVKVKSNARTERNNSNLNSIYREFYAVIY